MSSLKMIFCLDYSEFIFKRFLFLSISFSPSQFNSHSVLHMPHDVLRNPFGNAQIIIYYIVLKLDRNYILL